MCTVIVARDGQIKKYFFSCAGYAFFSKIRYKREKEVGRMSRILRFFVCLGTLFFAGNALAAGYSCSSLPTYLSCQHGYYMTANKSSTTHNGTPRVGNYCQPCSRKGSNYTCAGGTAAPVENAGGYTCPTYKKYTSCSPGYYMTDSSTSKTYNGSPKAGNACRPCSVYGANYTCAGGLAAPQSITINVTCPVGQYLPQGATSCTTCPAGSFCPGKTCNGVSLVTGATSACGLSSCSTNTGALYTNSASGSSYINDCYLTLNNGEAVEGVNGGKFECRSGYYCDNGGRKIYYDANNEERGLTDLRPTVAPGTACARGSYSGYSASSCDACQDGATTSGTGLDYCDAECSNSANVETWVEPTWTPNYVSNSCKIASCVACTKGTGVASCSASIENNACKYTATCATGYKNPTCNGSSCSCEVGSYTITLNATANGGTGGMSAVYEVPSVGWYSNAALTTSISSVTMPTKANSVFNGYYSAQSGGTRYITNAGALPSNTTFSANTTLYAQYSTASCNVTNGSATMSISGNKVSCAVTCNTGYSQSGGTNATTSFTVTGAVGTASVSASCSPRTFTVSLMNYDGTSTHSTIYEKYATGWYSNSAATTTLSKATVPTRSGYKFRGFYTAKQSDVSANGGSGTRRVAADGTLPANTTFTANTSLYAAWAKDCTVPANGSCTATIGSDGSVSYTTSCNTGYTLSGANTANPTCTPNIYTCSAGQYLKAGATACTTCTANSWCGGGTFSFNSGTDQGLNACPSDYSYSDAGTSSEDNCYKNATNTGSQIAPALPTGCAAQTVIACHPDRCWYRIYKSGTTTSCTPTNCNQTHKACTSASKNYYLASGVAKSCSSADASYPSSDGGDIAASSCYGTFSKTGSQVNGSVPTGCASVTSWNACTPGTCQYTKYASGTVKIDCTPTNCTKTVKSVTASAKYYANGASCTVCPDGYPNSDAGNSGGITACYSNSKSRAWTGSQVNGSTPTNCNSVTSWNACSLPACSYVAYSNSTGNGDGTIKSGCSTNNANCTKTVAAVTAKSGYYVSGTSCTECKGLASGMYPNSDNGNTGGASACRTDSLSGQVIATANASSATQCVPGTFKAAHTVNYGGTSSCGVCGNNQYSDAGAASCTGCKTANGYTNSGTTAESHAGVASCKATCAAGTYVATAGSACTTVGTGYWGAGGTVSQNTTLDRNQCPEKYRDGAAATQKSDCAVQTTAGKYIATAKATEQTPCPAKNYCPSESVKYGETNSPKACPTADATTARTTYPDDYLNPTRLSISNQGWSTGLPAITSCSANYTFTNAAGNFSVESVGYNATTGKYDVDGIRYYTMLNPGWYLKDRLSSEYCNTTSNPMYYSNVVQCPEDHYCPGYTTMPLCSSGEYTTEKGKNACSSLGTGVYTKSPVKSGAETACYLTTSNSKFVAAAGAAEGTCTAGGWCPGGVRVNYGSTGGRNTCPTKYPSSAASSNSELDCYVTTAAGKYVATVGAGQVNCAGTGYYCPGGTNVYSGAYGSRLTTGGRTQCPAGYRDLVATASTTKEAQCTMNVAGGKYVATAKESAASGTCDAGYAKAAHSVTYGNTSSCAACTGATYAASTGQASCTACPTAKTYASAVKSYGYWNNGKDGDHTISDGCYATMTGTLSNGSLTEHGCYLGTDGDYGNGGGKRCYVHQDNLKCNAGYYASTLSNGYVWNNTRAGLLGNTCVGVGAGYYSAANILTRNQCPTGLTTIGYGAGADEVTDCGRILHFGNDKLYLRSGKKTTPSLNVKIGDTTYYGNMTAGTGKGKLRLKSGSTTYSVHDDSM